MEALSSEAEPRQITIADRNLRTLHQKIVNERKQLTEDSKGGNSVDEGSL